MLLLCFGFWYCLVGFSLLLVVSCWFGFVFVCFGLFRFVVLLLICLCLFIFCLRGTYIRLFGYLVVC